MIPRYRTILYATDLTENSAAAFRHAVGVARCHDARLRVLHVLPEVDSAVVNYVATFLGEERLADLELGYQDQVAGEIRQRLEDFAKTELADHPEELARVEEIEVHHGHPVAVILDTAERVGADLLVLGSHGKGALKYAFLGSVASKVLTKSSRPVLVVPLNG